MAKVDALISHGADGRGGGPVRKLVDWVVGPFLDPGVEFESPWVEGCLINPYESAVLLDEQSEELPEDDSVLLHVRAVPVFGHLLAPDVRHIQLLLENGADSVELDVFSWPSSLQLDVD